MWILMALLAFQTPAVQDKPEKEVETAKEW